MNKKSDEISYSDSIPDLEKFVLLGRLTQPSDLFASFSDPKKTRIHENVIENPQQHLYSQKDSNIESKMENNCHFEIEKIKQMPEDVTVTQLQEVNSLKISTESFILLPDNCIVNFSENMIENGNSLTLTSKKETKLGTVLPRTEFEIEQNYNRKKGGQSEIEKINHVKTGHEVLLKNKCEKVFPNENIYHTESKMHTHKKKKKYYNKCDICSKTFQQLNRHKRIVHEGLKPFICNFCGKAFRATQDLHRHINEVHKGLKWKRYKCKFCRKAFSHTKDLYGHINKVHEGLKYKCNQCDNAYKYKDSLRRHITKFHNGRKLKN